ncbi:YitT family protein [Polluticoccus soli]|uniref:YitT family protein n=1 Tax=Polluticoccus soli TaxID=3034150 RepID=UPI0023E2B524|nr:YitT family protein [Flavipsychrobacter sp. JY13-12]
MNPLNKLPATLHDVVYILAGVIIAGFALKSFLVPNQFLDGGVTGISLLVHEIYHLNIGYIIILANIPFIIMGAVQVNKKFALKTLASVVALAACLLFIPYPVVTADKLLVSMFGGFFLGLGIGLGMRGGCAIDGMEVLALYTLRRSSFTISEIILGMNAIIFLIAALHFHLETALYAMLTYYVATRTIDYVIEGLEEYTGVTIISGKSDEIKETLVKKLGRGITVYKGERGFMKDSFEVSEDCDIVFSVITRLEVRRLRTVVHEIDPKAFVFTNTIKEAAGGVLKRKAGEH